MSVNVLTAIVRCKWRCSAA